MLIINISNKIAYPNSRRKFGNVSISVIMSSAIKVGINLRIHDFLWYIDEYTLQVMVYLNDVSSQLFTNYGMFRNLVALDFRK